MNQKRICSTSLRIYLWSGVLFVMALFPALGDEIIYRGSGQSEKGVILEETATKIRFRDAQGQEKQIDRMLIQEIRREVTAGVSLPDVISRTAVARQARDFRTAFETMLSAVRLSPSVATALSEQFQVTLIQADNYARDLYAKHSLPEAHDIFAGMHSVLSAPEAKLLFPNASDLQAWRNAAGRNLSALSYSLAIQKLQEPSDLPTAAELLKEAVRADAANTTAQLVLARVAVRLNDFELARSNYESVIRTAASLPELAKQARHELGKIGSVAPVGVAPPPPTGQNVAPSSQNPTPNGELVKQVPAWLQNLYARLAQIPGIRYVKPVWEELAGGQYNRPVVAVGAFILIFWMVPYFIVRMKSRKGDILAAEARQAVKRFGLIAFFPYLVKSVKTAKPQNRCPFCNKTLDRIDDYTDLNFYACPHCHESITPIYDLNDYVNYLIRQIETTSRHSKSGSNSVPERDAMLKLVRTILTMAFRRRASDLHLESDLEAAKLRIRVDGMMYDFLTLPKAVSLAFISALKIMANLDITERRVPQDGKISIWIDKNDLELRVNTSPSAMGEKVAIRILTQKAILVDPGKLGLEGENLERFEYAIHRPHGLIIVTGPAGSGKSTTLYVALNEIHTGEKNIVTLEDPIEYQLKGISQMQVNPAANFTFSSGLRSILRQDADVIMLGEVRDAETAAIVVDAALTGHLVLTTLHTIDSVTIFARLEELGVEPRRLANALVCSIAQRLVRVICSECKEPYKPKKADLEMLGLIGKQHEYTRGVGCNECMNTGYYGRIGIFEFFMLDAEIRELLEANATLSVIRELARKKGLHTLREEGIHRIIQGVTTVEEVIRVTS